MGHGGEIRQPPHQGERNIIMLALCLMEIEDLAHRVTFEELYYTYQNMMRSYACSLMQCRTEEADDVLQDVFLGIARNMDRICTMNPKALRSYVMVAVRNTVYKHRERAQKEQGLMQKLEEQQEQRALPAHTEDVVLAEVCRRENVQLMKELIRALPVGCRDVLELHYQCRMELKDIAKHLDISYNAVKKRYRRGNDLLAEGLRKGGVFDDHQ